jgi:hypothetical protein
MKSDLHHHRCTFPIWTDISCASIQLLPNSGNQALSLMIVVFLSNCLTVVCPSSALNKPGQTRTWNKIKNGK